MQQDLGADLVDVALIVVAGIFSLIFSAVLATILIELIGRPQALDPQKLATNPFLGIPTQLFAYAIVVGFMAFLASVRHGQSLGRTIHWNMPAGRLALTALGAGAVLGFSSQLASTLLERWTPKSLPIEQFFKGPASAYLLAGFGILVAPVVEELFFRGFLYPALARWTGSIVSILLTAAAFAALHGAQLAYAWAPLMVLFGVGLVLTIIRAKSGSVAACVIVHMGYNLTLFVMLYFLTGGFHHMERA